jgi:hypothetical protein
LLCAFASEGARVACVSRTEENAKKIADEINNLQSESARAYAVDVADHEAVQKMASRILEDFGRADILVNNAGVTRDTLAMRMSLEDWDTVINTNLRGAFSFTHALGSRDDEATQWPHHQYQLCDWFNGQRRADKLRCEQGGFDRINQIARARSWPAATLQSMPWRRVCHDRHDRWAIDQVKDTIHSKIPLGRDRDAGGNCRRRWHSSHRQKPPTLRARCCA